MTFGTERRGGPAPSDVGGRSVRLRRLGEAVVIVALAIVIYSVVRGGVNDYTITDPLGTLLASQNLLENGTYFVDAYRDHLLENREMYSYRFFKRDDHVLPYYPPGAVLLSTPFVWIANLQGYDMATIVDGRAVHDMRLQRDLAAGAVAVCFVLVYLICRCYFGPAPSLALSIPLVMGGPIASMLGVALWSTGFETVFILLSLLLIIADRRGVVRLNPYLLGVFLSLSFYCRPTSVTFILLASLIVLMRNRADFLKLVGVGLLFAAAFYAFSQHYYGQPVPRYYRPGGKVAVAHRLSSGLYGVMLSPSRGVLVFSPYLLLTVVGLVAFARRLLRDPLVWLCLAWFASHAVTVASSAGWWGGHTFGPRLMADAFPALVVLTILVWNAAASRLRPTGRWAAIGAFALLSAAAIWINVNQGLYNLDTAWWNAKSNVDHNREALMDWRYPQFLANPAMLEQLEAEYGQRGN